MAKGDIVGWIKGKTYNAKDYSAFKASLFRLGHTFRIGGNGTTPCTECGQIASVGMSVYLDGKETDEWTETCMNCGAGWFELPIYEKESANV